eukprot:COSAG02_NODE_262_length_26647_cov_21.607240_9_plen_154_part_00
MLSCPASQPTVGACPSGRRLRTTTQRYKQNQARQVASMRCGQNASEPTDPRRSTREIVGSNCAHDAAIQSRESTSATLRLIEARKSPSIARRRTEPTNFRSLVATHRPRIPWLHAPCSTTAWHTATPGCTVLAGLRDLWCRGVVSRSIKWYLA